MMNQKIITQFEESFRIEKKEALRGIGVECEIPVVTEEGEAVSFDTVQDMFIHLVELGFEVEWDDYSGMITSVNKVNTVSSERFQNCKDIITTDVGYSIIEIALAPQDNLHTIQTQLSELLLILTSFFDSRNCLMLGYGIQPMTSPSRELMMPKERYCFFEKLSTHRLIDESTGADASFLTITASNQCHVEIDLEDAIPATNVLNALSGLQIALHANSPIWQGESDTPYKANREMLWDVCFPNRPDQTGIPPVFEDIEGYVNYLLNFKPLLVKREDRLIQILDKKTFKDYLLDESPTSGKTLNGVDMTIEPRQDDIDQLIPFSWFNARLVPKHGTIESRMCCQQPPNETLTSAALTLGLVENLQASKELAKNYPLEVWRELRLKAAQLGFDTSIEEESILPLLKQLLDIARDGLLKRGLNEEIFLQPLYQRLEQRKTPADIAIAIFKQQGIEGFLKHLSFKNESYKEQTYSPQPATLI